MSSGGDTLTVLVARQEIRVRLTDIDAPESKQAFGSRSKQALSDLCFQKDARSETQGKDHGEGKTIRDGHGCGGAPFSAAVEMTHGTGLASLRDSHQRTGLRGRSNEPMTNAAIRQGNRQGDSTISQALAVMGA